jgi:hypothetical protein
MLEVAAELVKLFGIPVLLLMLYGPPSLLVLYFCVRDWKFTASIIEVLTKIETLLEERERSK